MVQRLWFGGDGYWRDPAAWVPGGVPQSGDTAIVNAGTLHVGGRTLSGITLELLGPLPMEAPTVIMHDLVLGADLLMAGPPPSSGAFGTIDAVGTVTNAGLVQLGGHEIEPGDLMLSIDAHGRFFNDGTFDVFDGSNLTVDGPGGFINNGVVAVDASTPVFNTDVSGTGTFELDSYVGANLTFTDHVATGVVVDLSTAGTGEVLVLDAPKFFHATVSGVEGLNYIELPTTTVDAHSFDANTGVLTLSDQGAIVAHLQLDLGGVSASDLYVTEEDGGTVVSDGYVPPAGAVAASMAHSALPQAMAAIGKEG